MMSTLATMLGHCSNCGIALLVFVLLLRSSPLQQETIEQQDTSACSESNADLFGFVFLRNTVRMLWIRVQRAALDFSEVCANALKPPFLPFVFAVLMGRRQPICGCCWGSPRFTHFSKTDLSIKLAISLSIYRSIYRSNYIYVFTCLSIYRFIYRSINLSIYLSIHPSICLLIDLSIYHIIYLHTNRSI